MRILSIIIGDSDDENNFPHKLLLNNTNLWKLCKVFANGSSAKIKLSKTQFHKIGQSVLTTLGLTAASSATDAAIHRKMFGSGTTTLIISN